MYFKNGKVKVELALAKGKQLWINERPSAGKPQIKKPREAVARVPEEGLACVLRPQGGFCFTLEGICVAGSINEVGRA